jgi:hypothetical protein
MKAIVWVALPLLFLAGCSDATGPVQTFPVSGEITYNGKAVAGIKVYLVPTSAPMMPNIPSNPHGETGPDGRFKLGTFTQEDGAAEGGYQIVLLWPFEKKEGDEESEGDRLYGWYDFAHSKLSYNVKTSNNQIPPIVIPDIKGPPPVSQGIPGRN